MATAPNDLSRASTPASYFRPAELGTGAWGTTGEQGPGRGIMGMIAGGRPKAGGLVLPKDF
jgi:hypothetical protein